MPLATIPEAAADLRAGRMVVIVDDEDRENEGDLACAAEKVTPQIINFMATHARGLVCMPITGARLDQLRVPLMISEPFNSSSNQTAFTVSVDAKHKTATGISAADRATTIRTILDPRTKPEDLMIPGHIFPLRAKEGGVLVRAGHTEAIVDLARIAGLYPAGVICEIMNEDGTMARLPQLQEFVTRWELKLISIRDLIAYRRQNEKLVTRVAEADFPTRYGDFRIVAFKSTVDFNEHVALVKGNISAEEPILVRMHSQCLTGDVLASQRCDCGDQVALALQAIEHEGRGVLVYMRQEGRGIGLHNKIMAYALQDDGMDTVEANIELGFPPDLRDYGIGAQILLDLGLRKVRLLTNNPKKVVGLEGYGLTIVEQIPLLGEVTAHNERYLRAKQEKLGHLLNME